MARISKFSLTFDVDGNWEHALSQLPTLFNTASQQAEQMAERTASSVERMDATFALQRMTRMGMMTLDAGLAIFEGFGKFVKKGIDTVAPLEFMMQRVMAIAKIGEEETRGILTNALRMAEVTPFLANDVARLTTAMALGKAPLGPLKEGIEDVTLKMAALKGWAPALSKEVLDFAGDMKVTTQSIVADLAAMVAVEPEMMPFFVAGMQRALITGDLRRLKDELPDHIREAVFGGLLKAKGTATEHMARLFEYLKREGMVGASAAAAGTFQTIVQNLGELPDVLFRNVFGMPGTGGFFDQFKEEFRKMFALLSKTFRDPRFLKSIKDAFTPIIELGLRSVRVLGMFVKMTIEFAKNHPRIMKFLVKTAVLIGVILTLGGAALAAVASFGLFVLTIKAILIAMPLIAAAVLPVIAVIAKIAVVAGAAVFAFELLRDAYETNFAGIGDSIRKTILVLKGLTEGIMNMTETSTFMSEETAAALEQEGLLKFVANVLSYANAIRNFFVGFAEGFIDMIDQTGVVDDLVMMFGLLFDTIGNVLREGDKGPSIWGANASTADKFGITLGFIVSMMIDLVSWTILAVIGLIKLGSWLAKNTNLFAVIITPLEVLIRIIGGVIKAFTLFAEGRWMDGIKELGLTLADTLLLPFEMMVDSIRGLAKLFDAEDILPDWMINFSKYGIRGVIGEIEPEGRPKREWKVDLGRMTERRELVSTTRAVDLSSKALKKVFSVKEIQEMFPGKGPERLFKRLEKLPLALERATEFGGGVMTSRMLDEPVKQTLAQVSRMHRRAIARGAGAGVTDPLRNVMTALAPLLAQPSGGGGRVSARDLRTTTTEQAVRAEFEAARRHMEQLEEKGLEAIFLQPTINTQVNIEGETVQETSERMDERRLEQTEATIGAR